MRVLGVIRLSRETDETTSPKRQRAGIEAWAASHEHEIVGWAEDIDVSGDVSPWDRAQLGPWLTDTPPAAYDIIAGTKIDRLSRSLAHFVHLIDWAKAQGRHVAAYMDSVDTSTETGEMIAKVLAIFAEFERKTIAGRAADSQRDALNEGRWHGGTPPYGYMPQRKPDGKGWTLAVDPESSERVKEIVRRIIAGESMNSICQDFDRQGIPTPSDHYRASVGKPILGHHWKTTALIPMLRSRTLIGEAEKDGKTIIGKDDKPVRRADDPILSYAEWRQVQDALDKLSRKKTRTAKTSPLLGIAFCECGEPLYRVYAGNKKDATIIYQYYRCRAKAAKRNCTAATIRAETLEAVAEESFLGLVGGLELLEKRLIPGDRHAAELAYLENRLRELREDRDAGLYEGEDKEYQARFLRHRERRDELAALPNVPDRWEDVPTGRTYRELWDSLEKAEERRAFLLASGVRVTVHAERRPTLAMIFGEVATGTPDGEGTRASVQIPPDLWQRVQDHAARMTS